MVRAGPDQPEGLLRAAGPQDRVADDVAVEIDVPLTALKPGTYLCQLNVVDDAGGSFAFPRFAVLVKPPTDAIAPVAEPAAAPAVQTSAGGAS